MEPSKWVLILTLMWNNTTGGISVDHIHGFQDGASCWNAGNAWSDHIYGEGRYSNNGRLTSSKYLRHKYICVPMDSMDDPRPTVLRGPINPNNMSEETQIRINYGDK